MNLSNVRWFENDTTWQNIDSYYILIPTYKPCIFRILYFTFTAERFSLKLNGLRFVDYTLRNNFFICFWSYSRILFYAAPPHLRIVKQTAAETIASEPNKTHTHLLLSCVFFDVDLLAVGWTMQHGYVIYNIYIYIIMSQAMLLRS